MSDINWNADMKPLWKDLKTDLERAEFLEAGRGYETGIVAKAVEGDMAKAFRRLAEEKDTQDGHRKIPFLFRR